MAVTGRCYLPLFRHQPGNTIVHRLPAGVKLIILMVLTILVFSGNRHFLIGAGGVTLLAAAVSRLRIAALLRLLKIVLFYGIFIAIVRIAGKERSTWMYELSGTLMYLWKLATVFTAGMVFFETTTGVAVHGVLSSVRNALSRLVPGTIRIPDFPRSFSLMLLFIPRIFDSWTALSRAWDARGGSLKRSLPAGVRKIITLVPLLIISLLDVADTTDRAIRNRS